MVAPRNDFLGDDPEFGREFREFTLYTLACWPKAQPLCLLYNRPFPSCLQSLFQSESKGKIFVMVISSNFNTNKNIFITKSSHLASLWNGGWGELGNGLFRKRFLSSPPILVSVGLVNITRIDCISVTVPLVVAAPPSLRCLQCTNCIAFS